MEDVLDLYEEPYDSLRPVVCFDFHGRHGSVEQNRFLELPDEFAVRVIQILCESVRSGEARRDIRRRFFTDQFAVKKQLRHFAVVCCDDVMPLVWRDPVSGE